MSQTVIKIGGMSCGGCVNSITRALTALPGVAKVEVSLAQAQAVIEFDPGKVDSPGLVRAIEEAGFTAE